MDVTLSVTHITCVDFWPHGSFFACMCESNIVPHLHCYSLMSQCSSIGLCLQLELQFYTCWFISGYFLLHWGDHMVRINQSGT